MSWWRRGNSRTSASFFTTVDITFLVPKILLFSACLKISLYTDFEDRTKPQWCDSQYSQPRVRERLWEGIRQGPFHPQTGKAPYPLMVAFTRLTILLRKPAILFAVRNQCSITFKSHQTYQSALASRKPFQPPR